MLIAALLPVGLVPGLVGAKPDDVPVRIRADFPGGNVRVLEQSGSTVAIAPDLRDGSPWFYWNFEATASQPGTVQFKFPAECGAQISPHGPAYSLDGGISWRWLGAKSFTPFEMRPPDGSPPAGDAFVFTFDSNNSAVRFSTGVPYLQSHLDGFLKRHDDNPYLFKQVLTQSAKGRNVEYLRIGTTQEGREHVLFTARSHACEAMASYVLEGFMQEALSDSPFARAFRDRYFLHVVPFLDKDGVEEGDQGKNRRPHDHNRDYGPDGIYPEIRAVKALADRERIQFGIDFHCPTLRMDIHQDFYWAGIGVPGNKHNLSEYSRWLGEEQPQVISSRGPRDSLGTPSPDSERLSFSQYFAYRKGMVLATTLEVPYAGTVPLDADLARRYGASMLRAWVRTDFSKPEIKPQGAGKHAAFSAFRQSFLDKYMRDPGVAEAVVLPYLRDADADLLYRIEAHNLMGTMRQRQQLFAEARQYFQFAMTNKQATASQRAEALTQSVRIATDPRYKDTSRTDVRNAALAFESLAYPSRQQQEQTFGSLSAYYAREADYEPALEYARRQLGAAKTHDKGRILNNMAAMYDQMQMPERAVDARREAVRVLREALDPVPVGIFGPLMAADLLDALNGIPDTTGAEKQAAADIGLKHPVCPPHLIERIRKALGEK